MGQQVLFSVRVRNALSARLFRLFYARRFAAFGPGTNIVKLELLIGARNISFGAGVVVAPNLYLAAMEHSLGQGVCIKIGDGARIGRNNHIFATRQIELGQRVLTASNVYIADNSHSYEDPDIAVFDQPVKQLGEVSIGDGTWIGHGASIIGVKIGRNCVVGAGAVVQRNVPDFCVVAGAPARIVKRYDVEARCWRRTKPDGSFRDYDD